MDKKGQSLRKEARNIRLEYAVRYRDGLIDEYEQLRSIGTNEALGGTVKAAGPSVSGRRADGSREIKGWCQPRGSQTDPAFLDSELQGQLLGHQRTIACDKIQLVFIVFK